MSFCLQSCFLTFIIDLCQILQVRTLILQFFANSVSQILLPVEGAHAAACEEMASAMSSAEAAAYKGLQLCIETVMAEVSTKILSGSMIFLFLRIEFSYIFHVPLFVYLDIVLFDY